MWDAWTPLLFLALTIIPLLVLKRWITRHLQGLGLLIWGESGMTVILYFLALLPGILIHELSHWLFAKVLWVKTGKVSIWPSRSRMKGRVRLGSVEMVHADPFRSSLIGLAPLIMGSLVIFLIGDSVLGVSQPMNALFNMDWAGFRAGLSSYTQAPDFWVWVYVIFAVSNAMFPSESDRESWGTVLVFLGVLAAVVYLSGWVTQISEEVISVLLNLARYLAYAFALTVVVDVVFAIVIALFEKLVGTLKGVTVQY